MPTIGSITKTIRISPGDLGVIEGIMKDGTSWSGAVHKLCQNYTGTPVQKPAFEGKNKDLAEVEGMASLCGCTPESLYKQLNEMLEEGGLLINRGKVGIGLPRWVERFIDACNDKCLDAEKIGESAVKAIERGTLQ